jgi:hypothetical protein
MKPTAKKKPLPQKSDKLPAELLYEYRKDIDNWAEAWEISRADIRTGKALTEEFKKFLIPININNNHWTLICCILTFSTRTIEISYYDSFGPHPTASDKYCTAAK